MELTSGNKCGIEGATHTLNDLHSEHSTSPDWGLLPVDASNTFNSLNRAALLWNVCILWPRCSRFFFNTYNGQAALVVRGTDEFLYSREGVTQGDPLSMFLYAVGTLPLIRLLRRPSMWTQMWYADDTSACGRLTHIWQWFNLLLQKGPSFSYFPNPGKSSLVVDSASRSSAKQLFGPLGVKIFVIKGFWEGFLAALWLGALLSWARFISGSWTSRTCHMWLYPSLGLCILHW